jgi:phage regulator Rha-like protein
LEKITPKVIEKMIYIVRGQKVMFDSDLAELYGVLTKNLNKAVKRNIDRFPSDFMFKLSEEEFEVLRFQIGTSKRPARGGRRYMPFVFTEAGIAMLSSVLTSEQAININISIVRTFIKMRQLLASEESLTERLQKLEKGTDKLFRIVFERLDTLDTEVPTLPKKRRRIGLKK